MVSFVSRLDLYGRMVLPALLTLILVLISAAPVQVDIFGIGTPAFTLIAVYYWSLHHPGLMPAWLVFAIGVFEDLLIGAPLGVGTLLLLVTHVVISSQRRFLLAQPASMLWFGFILVALVAMAARWLMESAIAGHLFALEQPVMQIFASALAFPPVAWLLSLIRRLFLRQADD